MSPSISYTWLNIPLSFFSYSVGELFFCCFMCRRFEMTKIYTDTYSRTADGFFYRLGECSLKKVVHKDWKLLQIRFLSFYSTNKKESQNQHVTQLFLADVVFFIQFILCSFFFISSVVVLRIVALALVFHCVYCHTQQAVNLKHHRLLKQNDIPTFISLIFSTKVATCLLDRD